MTYEKQPELTKWLAKLLLDGLTLGQSVSISHPGIESTIKVNNWAWISAASMPGQQGMTLQGGQSFIFQTPSG